MTRNAGDTGKCDDLAIGLMRFSMAPNSEPGLAPLQDRDVRTGSWVGGRAWAVARGAGREGRPGQNIPIFIRNHP